MHPIVIITCIIVSLLAVAAVFFTIRSMKKKSEKKALQETQDKAANKALWQTLNQRYHTALATVESYKTDLTKALQYPAMNDPEEISTKLMLESLNTTQSLFHKHHGVDTPPVSFLEEFSDAVRNFEHTVTRAEEHAYSIGIKRFGYLTEKDISKAQKALNRLSGKGFFTGTREKNIQIIEEMVYNINERNRKDVIPVESTKEIYSASV